MSYSDLETESERYFPWLKVWASQWLTGSIRYNNNLEEQGFFIGLLAIANQNRHERGVLSLEQGQPMPLDIIAHQLFIDTPTCERIMAIMLKQGRVGKREDGCLYIPKFLFYQEGLGKVRKDEAKARGELEAGGVEIEESREVKEIDIVYGQDGEIDEHKSILFTSSLWNVRESLKGNRETLPANLERYRAALRELRIPFEEAE